MSIADLLDRFGRQTELQEEELWVRLECTTEGSEVVRLVEPLKDKIMQLEERVAQLEQKSMRWRLDLSLTNLSGSKIVKM